MVILGEWIVCLHVHKCMVCVHGTRGGQRECQVLGTGAVNCQVDAGNWIRVVWKSSGCSSPQRYLSSPCDEAHPATEFICILPCHLIIDLVIFFCFYLSLTASFIILNLVYVCVFVCGWVWLEVSIEARDVGSPRLELQVVWAAWVDAGNWTWVFCRSSKYLNQGSISPALSLCFYLFGVNV